MHGSLAWRARRWFFSRAAIGWLLGIRLAAGATALDLPADISVWDKSVTLRTGLGYKDNLLLSGVTREKSPFEISAVEVGVFRLPIDGPQVNVLVNFEDTRFWEGRVLDKEQFLGSQMQIKEKFNDHWTGRLTLEYVYQNQVIDASDALPSLNSVRVVGHTLAAGPALRRDFEHCWLEGSLTATRQFFARPLDNYWAGASKITLGRDYGHRSEFSASYELSERVSDSAPETDSVGFPVSGTTLEYLKHRADLTLRHNWDPQRHWRTTSQLGFTANQDNGSGYYDYQRFHISQQLRYVASDWEIKARARCAHYHYPVQSVSAVDRSRRRKDDLALFLRAEKSLTKFCKLFGEYEHERSFSNRSPDQYAANTVTGGIEWEF